MAHAAWAAIAITVSLFMIFTKQRGDPPMMIFVPLVLKIWAVGHFVIWAVHWLAASGQRIVSESGGERKPWPIGLRLALIGTGGPALIGIFQLLMTGLQRKWYPFLDAGLWGVMLAVWLVHGVCFAGMLLRLQWSRVVSAMLSFGWALLLASQIAEHLSPRVSSDTAELLTAVVLMMLLLLFGLYLAASRKVKSFFRR
jgi:hypothetical protein